MHTRETIFTTSLCLFLIGSSIGVANAEETHHRNHVAVGTGITWHDSHDSAYLGVDYVYRISDNYGVGAFYEEVSGDFDLRAYGLTFGRYFANGWKIGAGAGVERKLKDNKTLFLFHVSTGYDWHRGSWTFGPTASIDFIEDSSTSYYLGVAVGYGF